MKSTGIYRKQTNGSQDGYHKQRPPKALHSLKNNAKHTLLIEEIRKKLAEMGTTNWTI